MENQRTKSDKILTGVAGEYLVAGELSKRGYIASITLRNTKGIDILASNQNASRSIGIQVKASKHSKARNWVLTEKAENYYADNLFYIFVNLRDEHERPDFFIVPSKIVAQNVKNSHQEWLKSPNKKGGQHKDNPLRSFSDKDGSYFEKWDVLGL